MIKKLILSGSMLLLAGCVTEVFAHHVKCFDAQGKISYQAEASEVFEGLDGQNIWVKEGNKEIYLHNMSCIVKIRK